MHRSEDRDLLGRSSSDDDVPAAALTRRERRRLHSTPDAPLVGLDLGLPEQRPASLDVGEDSEFSLATLFARTHETLPDGQPRILTVCTGNICRSPLAEVVLATRLADLGVSVHSAGTHALVGHGMPTPARALAEQHGVPSERFNAHEARLLTERIIDESDLVLAMTAEHSTLTVQLAPRRLHHTFTLREFGRLAASLSDEQLRSAARPGGNARSKVSAVITAVANQRGTARRTEGNEDVIDPYRQSAAVYAQSAAEMMPAIDQVERVVRAALG